MTRVSENRTLYAVSWRPSSPGNLYSVSWISFLAQVLCLKRMWAFLLPAASCQEGLGGSGCAVPRRSLKPEQRRYWSEAERSATSQCCRCSACSSTGIQGRTASASTRLARPTRPSSHRHAQGHAAASNRSSGMRFSSRTSSIAKEDIQNTALVADHETETKSHFFLHVSGLMVV